MGTDVDGVINIISNTKVKVTESVINKPSVIQLQQWLKLSNHSKLRLEWVVKMEVEVKAEDNSGVEIVPAIAILGGTNVNSDDDGQGVSTQESIADC